MNDQNVPEAFDHPMTPRCQAIALALLLLALSACTDSVGPPGLGVWVLERADGEALPVNWSSGEVMWTLVADTLVLTNDGRFTRRRSLLVDGLANHQTWQGTQIRDGAGWALLDDACTADALALCIPPPRMYDVVGGLELRQDDAPFESLVFGELDGE